MRKHPVRLLSDAARTACSSRKKYCRCLRTSNRSDKATSITPALVLEGEQPPLAANVHNVTGTPGQPNQTIGTPETGSIIPGTPALPRGHATEIPGDGQAIQDERERFGSERAIRKGLVGYNVSLAWR
ncbi:hypothetical protein [Mesorhizobium sp. ES1-4]|uniref:hypothetical protein n=1 Tax=Mesorhizobium sp. ES1-4 TaxID=2876627 RepID=UPI001CD01317|nr:hypothetical protein [Mesorhizobium sp. ES1-4]MBZ9798376.1 hypothetical protein [Mesorhizobium sp. ES1-4]